MEVLVLRDQETVALTREIPHGRISGTAGTETSDVIRLWNYFPRDAIGLWSYTPD